MAVEQSAAATSRYCVDIKLRRLDNDYRRHELFSNIVKKIKRTFGRSGLEDMLQLPSISRDIRTCA